VILPYNIRSLLKRFLPLLLLVAAVAARGDVLPRELRGGHFATITLDPKFVDAHTEEWEAFLSVNGGHYYSIRLTPHVDAAIRTLDALIPNVDTSNARVLFRTGNEHMETLHLVSTVFHIHADPSAPIPLSREGLTSPEGARPGEPAVVMWTDARGIHTAAEIPISCQRALGDDPSEEWVPLLPLHVTSTSLAVAARLRVERSRTACHPARFTADVLLLSTRMNV
jgi:hypothetical protein